MLAELRKTLAALERSPGLDGEAGMLASGIPPVDAALGGGLARGALHEIAAISESHLATATAFALGITGARAGPAHRATVWIAPDMALAENGAPCGSGLDDMARPPERILTVTVNRTRDLLWAMEEALHCRAVGVAIGELRNDAIDSVALRRLSLAAATHRAIAVVLRAAPTRTASVAVTRWVVSAAPSQPRFGRDIGTPRIAAQLVRNRRGPLGDWILEWSDRDERFVLAATHPQPVARPAADRPARAAAG